LVFAIERGGGKKRGDKWPNAFKNQPGEHGEGGQRGEDAKSADMAVWKGSKKSWGFAGSPRRIQLPLEAKGKEKTGRNFAGEQKKKKRMCWN